MSVAINVENKKLNVDLYDSFFHLAYPNNYVYLLIPKRYDEEAYLLSIKQITQPLNEASNELFKCCRWLLGNQIHPALEEWHQGILSVKNILTIYPAEKLISFIEHTILKEPIKNYLEKNNPLILQKFIQIPKELIEVTRINFYFAYEELQNVVEKFLDQVYANPILAEKIERIEVAQGGIENREKSQYPTLIIYLNPENFNDLELKNFLQAIALFSKNNKGVDANPEYAYIWFSHVTVTQGYRLYKRYLKLLGLFTEVYDGAFLKNHTDFWKQHLNLLL